MGQSYGLWDQQAAYGVILGAAPSSAGWPDASRWLDQRPRGDLAVSRKA
jgi:hypothetical protein